MWLLRASTLAGCVGLASFPALHQCTSRNVICGTSSYERYVRSAEIDEHISRVLEFMFEEAADLLLDVVYFLHNTGHVVIVVDLAKYIGIAFCCVALDHASRYLSRLLRAIPLPRSVTIQNQLTDRSALDVFASAILEPDTDDCPEEPPVENRPLSISWHSDGNVSSAPEQEKIPEMAEDSLDQLQLDPVAPEDKFLQGKESSAGSTGSLGVEKNGSFIGLHRDTDTDQLPSSDESNQDQRTFDISTVKVKPALNPYDADISDQEVVLSSQDCQPQSRRFLSGSEITHQGVQSALSVPRNSLSNSLEINPRTNSPEQLHGRTESTRTGTYSSLRRLHSPRRSIPRPEADPDSEIYTVTSSGELTNSDVPESRPARPPQPAVPTSDSDNDVFDASSYILSSRSLSCEEITEGNGTQEASIMESVEPSASELIQGALSSVENGTADLEDGEQKVEFWQFPLYHTSASALLSCPDEGFTPAPLMAAQEAQHADVSDTSTLAAQEPGNSTFRYGSPGTTQSRHSALLASQDVQFIGIREASMASREPRNTEFTHGSPMDVANITSRPGSRTDAQQNRNTFRGPNATIEGEGRQDRSTSQPISNQRGLYYPLDADDTAWRLFLIQVLFFVIIGRRWRRHF